ncbi:uncharacterized protein N7529_004772 [Penicillium soppii]|uniref:uncharacterized protein n=1 Tax=Penicillium soppii TaxID=69789 RepID=UPI0025498FAB|nr:uncharacterized protein N7529_004772 [Penicillium soppii]KAJ5872419.1 hypothetical protein N7529_004772 [Penicillium soppii]
MTRKKVEIVQRTIRRAKAHGKPEQRSYGKFSVHRKPFTWFSTDAEEAIEQRIRNSHMASAKATSRANPGETKSAGAGDA